MIERDEDTFAMLKEMAEDIHLVSRNHNDELIGIEYYHRLDVLTDEELGTLVQLWERKVRTCHKEKLASQWMVVQLILFVSAAIWMTWQTGGWVAVIATMVGMITMIKIMEDKRVRIAKRNLADARQVFQHLSQHHNARKVKLSAKVDR